MLAEEMIKQDDIPPWYKYPLSSNYCFNKPLNAMELDFAWPEYKIGIEVNGSQWVQNKGHNSGRGVERDARKLNAALLRGWLIIVVVTDHIEKQMSTYTIPTIRGVLLLRGAPLINYEKELETLFETTEELLT